MFGTVCGVMSAPLPSAPHTEQKKPAPASAPLPARFPLPLRLERTAPFRAVTLAPFVFLSPTVGRVEVETGFDTDYASVPRALWGLYPPDGDYTPAAVIHDALYWHQATAEPTEANLDVGHVRTVCREVADRVFLEAMEALAIPAARRRILYRAVRLFGARAWENNARHHVGLPTVEASTPVERRLGPGSSGLSGGPAARLFRRGPRSR